MNFVLSAGWDCTICIMFFFFICTVVFCWACFVTCLVFGGRGG